MESPVDARTVGTGRHTTTPMEIPIPSELLKNQAFVKPGVYTIPIPLAGAGVHVWAGRKYAETMLVSSRFELL
jgi:hypothetical protein